MAAKAALIYLTALFALRFGERRTLAQWTLLDFAVAVAIGAIVGRTATAGSQSYATGAVAVVTLVLVHRVVSILRFNRTFRSLVDHRVRVLVEHGQVSTRALRRSAITQDDLFAHLRQQGVFDLAGVRYVLYETKGGLTVVPEASNTGGREAPLVAAGLERAL